MADLSRFTAFAPRSVAVPHPVPLCSPARGTSWGTEEHLRNQRLIGHVPRVPLVPREIIDAGDEIDARMAFEERAAILEFDAGVPRQEAERQARDELEARNTAPYR